MDYVLTFLAGVVAGGAAAVAYGVNIKAHVTAELASAKAHILAEVSAVKARVSVEISALRAKI